MKRLSERVIVFDHHWQTPAITEYHSYQKILELRWDAPGYTYVAFPWATLIDLLQTGQDIPVTLTEGFEKIITGCRDAKRNGRLLTVCQHIYAHRFSSLFKACSLDIVYWSHATIDEPFHDGIEWRPFPLYPVQRYSPQKHGPLKPLQDRKYNGSFIGAYEAKYYLSKIREEIFKLSSLQDTHRLLITKRDEWHFQEAVYDCQINGLKPKDAKQRVLEVYANQYRDALMESVYSLCPSGSGPNSIRLWESLTYGCIPVIFADSLALPGEQQVWIEACVFMGEASSCPSIIEELLWQNKTTASGFKTKQEAGKLLESRYGVEIFIWDLLHLDENCASGPYHETKPLTHNLGIQQKDQLVIVVDPGLRDVGSHHHKINSQLANDLDETEILVLCHQQFDAGNLNYQTRPVFSFSVYDDRPNLSSEDYCYQVSVFTKELTQALRQIDVSPWLYIHTATAAHIQMIANSIQLLKDNERPLGISLQLMFEPRSLSSSQNALAEPRSTSRYKSAIHALGRRCQDYGIALTVETSNPIFQKTFTSLIGEPKVGLHPHLFHHCIKRNEASAPPPLPYRLLIHSGDPRRGKGLEWIMSQLREWIQKTDDDLQFVMHIGRLRFPKDYGEIAQAISTIERIADGYPDRVTVKRGYLGDDQWADLALNTHAIALLHDPTMYRFKTSGNLYDYLEITNGNRLVLATADTNSISNLSFYGISHVEVVYGDGDSLLAAINTMKKASVGRPAESEGWANFSRDFFTQSNSQHLQSIIQAR